MPQLAIAAGASAAFVTAVTIAVYVVQVGLLAYSFYAKRRAKQKAIAQAKDALQDRAVTVSTSNEPRKLVYGHPKNIGGNIVHRWVTGDDKEFLHLVICYAGCQLDAITEIKFDGKQLTLDANGNTVYGTPYYFTKLVTKSVYVAPSVTTTVVTFEHDYESIIAATTETGEGDNLEAVAVSWGAVDADQISIPANDRGVTVTYRIQEGEPVAFVKKFLGQPGQSIDADLLAAGGGFTANDKFSNTAGLYVRLKMNNDWYSQGLPNITISARGKPVYDPRTGLTSWSDNAALVALDYLTDPIHGYGEPLSRVNIPAVIASANNCDEAVPILGGGTQKRYTINGLVSTQADWHDNLEVMADTMGGAIFSAAGVWSIHSGRYEPPVSLEVKEDDFAEGDITIACANSVSDLFNTVKGSYYDPISGAPVAFPVYSSSAYKVQDGGIELVWQRDYPLIDDGYLAQRIAKLELFTSRDDVVFTAKFKLKMMRLEPFDRVRVTVPRYGWNQKIFRVLSNKISADCTCEITLKEDGPSAYAWDYQESLAVDPTPNTSLPSTGVVEVIAGLAVSTGATIRRELPDGTVIAQARVTWAEHVNALVKNDGRIVLKWRRSNELDWSGSKYLEGFATRYDLEPVSFGEMLIIEVYAENGIGVKSLPSTIVHQVSATTPGNTNSSSEGYGANLLEQSSFKNGISGWGESHTGAATNFVMSWIKPSEADAPNPFGCLRIVYDGANGTQVNTNSLPSLVPVIGGERYEASAYIGIHRGAVGLSVVWLDSAGSTISQVAITGGVSSVAGNTAYPISKVGDLSRAWGFVNAPSNAAKAAIVSTITRDTTTGAGLTTMWLTMPLFAVAARHQTSPSPWSDGTPRGLLSNKDTVFQSAEYTSPVGTLQGDLTYVELVNSPFVLTERAVIQASFDLKLAGIGPQVGAGQSLFDAETQFSPRIELLDSGSNVIALFESGAGFVRQYLAAPGGRAWLARESQTNGHSSVLMPGAYSWRASYVATTSFSNTHNLPVVKCRVAILANYQF